VPASSALSALRQSANSTSPKASSSWPTSAASSGKSAKAGLILTRSVSFLSREHVPGFDAYFETMLREKVSSDALRSVGYDRATHTLETEFTTDRIYQYFNCPPEVFDALMHADSKGRFYNLQIRDHYPFKQIS
jgi:hypothetical protein